MFSLLFLIPQVLSVGHSILKCIEGGTTKEEWEQTVDSIYALCMAIPQLQGFLALFQVIFKVIKVVFPMIVDLEDDDLNKAKLKAAKQSLSEDDVKKALTATKLLMDVSSKVAANQGLTDEVKKYHNESDYFDTGSFFEEYKGENFTNR